MSRRLRLVFALAVSSLLLGPAAAVAGTVSSSSGPLKVTVHAGTHHPNCRQKWPVTVTATLGGRPARGVAYYQFLHLGTLVSTQYPFSTVTKNQHPYHFRGHFTDTTFGPFGSLAVGYPLTIRVVVRSGGQTVYVPYDVTVRLVPGCRAVH